MKSSSLCVLGFALITPGPHAAVTDFNAAWSGTPLSAWQRLDGTWKETRDVLNSFVFSQSAALAPGGTTTVDSILLVGAGDPPVAVVANTLRLDGRARARLGPGETWIEVLP